MVRCIAYLARAELALQLDDKTAAVADLEAADAVAPKEASLRLRMAFAYERLERLKSAIAQTTLWIDSHEDDARLTDAMGLRCWARALDGTDIALALKDCNAAIKSTDKSSGIFAKLAGSRGLVYLRIGDYERSIADYDTALRSDAKDPWSLYGRGIGKLRKHENAAGNLDIANATAIWPQVGEQFARRGIVP